MKKLLTVCGLALIGLQNVTAQTEDTWMPKQLGIGVGVGTTGIVIDASTTLNRWLGVRAGVDIMPKIKVNTDLDLGTQGLNDNFQDMTDRANKINAEYRQVYGHDLIDLSGLPDGHLPENMDVQGKLTNTTFHFLVDVYPFKRSSFHATAGFYAGGKEFVSVYNKTEGFLTPVTQWNDAVNDPASLPATARQYIEDQGMIGAELGDYFITPNPANNGNVKATVEVNAFRPYLGIGFGRAVPRKKRIGCQFDLGVQFWGTPKVYAPTYNKETGTYQNERLTEEHAGGDGSDIIKIISSIPVYPTLNFRLVGRIF